ncbi:uncharacterized protein K452DRAFT_256893 [Aplosporella prunicola CBS 121167]|uniref:SH3 domain-containing protein n=1 Tax=Aplosporella prunicola CBS 121167 TaxID=1176127 RepID=A0A6A6B2N0_9PEZI|nr:uncharacterized protein K452DRAFT_256893 [Aplosporella prunicola CBS 121167]KAF2138066.1 hypothetical protein K452DRAFT_256893 [Aplosporella prunicola CBS 121167]
MSPPPFKVRALYEYSSPHEDDLNFPEGALITVTAEEDADWYVGEYILPNGGKNEGLFPKNFVERYEPEPPPRPNRASRPPPPPEAPPPVEHVPAVEEQAEEPSEPVSHDEAPPTGAPAVPESPQAAPRAPQLPSSPPPAPIPKPQEQPSQPQAAKPAPASAGQKSPPPPVAEKPMSFKERIAAFNKPAAAPIAPIKPKAPPAGFIKKPFVAPPPSRDAYVPPPREPAPQKIYRRDEDPEVAERSAQQQESTEQTAPASGSAATEEEDQPKPTSLKERIALLQKQQMEQAARQAEASQKEKPKRPPKKRIESHDSERRPVAEEGVAEGGERGHEAGQEEAQALPKKRHSRGPLSPDAGQHEREMFSDGNDADMSAAGETTEDAEESSTTVEEEGERAHAAPSHEPEAEQEGESTEEEDDGLDEETRRRMELRERIAKMSGGMGMAGMFGPPGGMPIPGMPMKPKKPAPSSEATAAESKREPEQSPPPPTQRVPMIPIPGMPHPVRSPDSEDTELAVEKEEEPQDPVTGERGAEEVPDIEDVKPEEHPRASLDERAAPPPQERPVPPPPATERPVPPPIPGDRPVPPPESRPAPPPPPVAPQSPSAGSESDDEMAGDQKQLPLRGAPPLPPGVPPVPQSPPSHQRNFSGSGPMSPQSRPSTSSDKRSSRAIPPIPIGSPIMAPAAPAQARPPPPPPPTGAPPSRQPTKDVLSPHLVPQEDEEGETDYEGDYDTDIASGAPHKDALKAHVRDQSYDDSTLAGDTPVRSPIVPSSALPHPMLPGTVPRPVPPPPPQQPPSARQSLDAPRAAPPPPPPGREPMSPVENENEYDPYRHSSISAAPRAAPPPPAVPPPAPAQAPESAEEEEEEDELYSSPPPKRFSQHAPPPPHQELPERQPPQSPPQPSRTSAQYSRRSLDVERTLGGSRRSMDQSRPSLDHGHIANDVDLGAGSQWWSQPNTPPPVFQNRKDVLYEIEESSTSKRGGKKTIQKDVYVLFQDYSQTIVTVRFDARNPEDVSLEQRHEPPPPKLRQDQLEDAYEQFGRRISNDVNAKQNTTVGDGSPQALVHELVAPLPQALLPIGTRAYGALVYANLANASVQQHDEIRPGDIISLRNAKFQGKHGPVHAKYSMEVGKPDHVGVVVEWDGTKKKIRAFEQGRESKKVKVESFRMSDLRSGEVRVWRVTGRSWVGWDAE